MSEDVLYICEVCGAEYDVETAIDMAFTCHGKPLSRQSPGLDLSGRARTVAREATEWLTGSASDPLFDRSGEPRAVEIIPPLDNEHEAQVVEALLASIAAGDVFSLEIAATSDGRRFLARGTPATLAHVVQQLRAAYGQVNIRELDPNRDPAEMIRLASTGDSFGVNGKPVNWEQPCAASGRLRLNRPIYYPLRTYKEFELGDPITTLLGGFYGLRPGEIALSQMVMSPAPDNWSDAYQPAAVVMSARGQQMTMAGQTAPAAFAGGIIVFVIALALSLAFHHSWLCMGVIWLTVGGIFFGLVKLGQKAHEWTTLNPEVIKRKISQPAFYVDFRLWAVSDASANARQLLARVASAYRLFNLAEGNRLELWLAEHGDGAGAPIPRGTLVNARIPHGMRTRNCMRNPRDLTMPEAARATILNITELAGMWHLPLGGNPDQVTHGLHRKFLPVPSTVNGEDSLLIGASEKDGQQVPVALSRHSVRDNMFIIGKTQMGKTTTMGHIAGDTMARAEGALVVVTPHRDLVDYLCAHVPPERIDDVVLLDLSDTARSAGLNLLDAHGSARPGKLVADMIAIGKNIWKDYWGPRMENVFAYAALTLAQANLQLGPDQQFTILDIPYLFWNETFRNTLLVHYVIDRSIHDWWLLDYSQLPNNFRVEVLNPVLSKIGAFRRADAVCHVVAQSRSTLDLRGILADRKMLLVNTAAGEIGTEVGGFLGAVVINSLEAAIREQIALDRAARPRALVIIDEFQAIPGVNYGALLAELLKMGANFILATQSLDQLDANDPHLKGTVIANSSTVIAFQCSGKDAEYLYNEFDQMVEVTDLTNIDPYSCYIKTINNRGKRLPVYNAEIMAPRDGESGVMERIRQAMARYTTPVAQVEAQINARADRWYPAVGRQPGAQAVAQQVAQGQATEDVFVQFTAITSGAVGQDANTRRPAKSTTHAASGGA